MLRRRWAQVSLLTQMSKHPLRETHIREQSFGDARFASHAHHTQDGMAIYLLADAGHHDPFLGLHSRLPEYVSQMTDKLSRENNIVSMQREQGLRGIGALVLPKIPRPGRAIASVHVAGSIGVHFAYTSVEHGLQRGTLSGPEEPVRVELPIDPRREAHFSLGLVAEPDTFVPYMEVSVGGPQPKYANF